MLSELNNKINGKRINDVVLKNKIFNELFKTNKKVTLKRLVEYLRLNGFNDLTNADISGLSKNTEFISSLSSYIYAEKNFWQRRA